MAEAAIVDCYQCIIEPPSLWNDRLPSRLKGLAPKVVHTPAAGEAWALEGGTTLFPLSHLLLVEKPLGDETILTNSYKTMQPGCFDAKERIKDMDTDGMAIGIVFPQVGLQLHHTQDPQLYEACVRAYNDGLWEWCRGGDPKRLIPVAIVPTLGAEKAAAELSRVAALGYKAMVFTGWPNGATSPDETDDRFWSVCEETQVVVCFNSGPVAREQPKVAARAGAAREARVVPKPPMEITLNNVASGLGAPQVVGRLALRGVFEKFPNLKVCYSGTGAGWLPYFLEQVDGMYFHDRFYGGFGSKMLPSEYIKRNTRLTFHLDTNAIRNRDEIGVENLMWGSHYPLETCDWPRSREIIEAQLRDVPESERRLMLAENAKAYFNL